jgi:hypothetical protein
VLTLLLIVAVTGLTLGVFFYVGSLFFQGYIYTEPSQDLKWQAPAAGAALMVFFMLWCVLIANTEGATPSDIPYDTVFRFSPRADLLKEPADRIWAVGKDGTEKTYKRERRGQTMWRYVDPSYTPSRPWRGEGIDGVLLEIDGEKQLFKRVTGSDGSNPEFVNDSGWAMKDYGDGPSGVPSIFRWSRFMMNFVLNFGHFLLWWLCLWLLLRYQWSHALGLGFVLWLIFTLSILPMLLNYAAEVAQSNAAATTRQA